jgi:hypothetical protein
LRNVAPIAPRQVADTDAPISKALALGTPVAAALSLVERYDAARRALELSDESRRREFFDGLDVAELQRASAALLEASTERFEPRKCAAMFALVLDALPAAINFDSATYRQVLAGLIETDDVNKIEWRTCSHEPDRVLELRGFGRIAVSRAMRSLLMECEFAPAPSKVMQALKGARSVMAHGHIKAERLLAERSRLLERERRLAEIELQFVGRDRKDVIAELRAAPSAPNPLAERARQIAAEQRERWRQIAAGELNPFADLLEEG